jgi:hypothetical protein
MNGSNQYFNRGAAFTSIADSKTGIISFWVKWGAASDAQFNPILYGDSNNRIYKSSDDKLYVDFVNGSAAVSLQGVSTWTSASGWTHVIMAWDSSDINKSKTYVNGSSDANAGTQANVNILYTGVTDWGVMALAGGALPVSCCISELYFAAGQWLDLTNSTNVQKFRTSGGKPVNLGTDGSTPTGSAPTLYMHVYDGTNAGSGGNLTLHNGALSGCTAP